MENKIITVSILGLGNRGGEVYGRYMDSLKDKYKIKSICTKNVEKLNKYGNLFGIEEDNRFSNETEFFKEKRSDLIIISTPDKLHYRQALKSIRLGYDVLLEKPISDSIEEISALEKEAKKRGRKIVVCHVLRYTAMINKLKEIIDSGKIGKLISIDHTENVAFWHQAHAYVRGNWRKREDCAPMIMTKCCHDLDLIQYFAGSKCYSVSSMGDLRYFRKENKPIKASNRCADCVLKDECAYSAYKIYRDKWIEDGEKDNTYPQNVITNSSPITKDSIEQAIENNEYGKCVFSCDNDVVDNQVVLMSFENGITATLRMIAFTKYLGRNIRFFGAEGELELIEEKGTITLKPFKGNNRVWRIKDLTDDLEIHGGGDHRMVDELYKYLTGETANIETSIFNSVESHYMAICAEHSRLNDGKLEYIIRG